MRHAAVSLMKLVQVGMLASCSYPPLPHVDVPREVEQFAVTQSRALDLLFLIDDSPSMADKHPGRDEPGRHQGPVPSE